MLARAQTQSHTRRCSPRYALDSKSRSGPRESTTSATRSVDRFSPPHWKTNRPLVLLQSSAALWKDAPCLCALPTRETRGSLIRGSGTLIWLLSSYPDLSDSFLLPSLSLSLSLSLSFPPLDNLCLIICL